MLMCFLGLKLLGLCKDKTTEFRLLYALTMLVSRCEPQACCGEKANTVGAPRSQTPHDAVILHWAWAYIISIEQRVYTTPECWREYSTPVFIDLKTFQSE